MSPNEPSYSDIDTDNPLPIVLVLALAVVFGFISHNPLPAVEGVGESLSIGIALFESLFHAQVPFV